jgi:hypothetical protein
MPPERSATFTEYNCEVAELLQERGEVLGDDPMETVIVIIGGPSSIRCTGTISHMM